MLNNFWACGFKRCRDRPDFLSLILAIGFHGRNYVIKCIVYHQYCSCTCTVLTIFLDPLLMLPNTQWCSDSWPFPTCSSFSMWHSFLTYHKLHLPYWISQKLPFALKTCQLIVKAWIIKWGAKDICRRSAREGFGFVWASLERILRTTKNLKFPKESVWWGYLLPYLLCGLLLGWLFPCASRVLYSLHDVRFCFFVACLGGLCEYVHVCCCVCTRAAEMW